MSLLFSNETEQSGVSRYSNSKLTPGSFREFAYMLLMEGYADDVLYFDLREQVRLLKKNAFTHCFRQH